MAVMPFPYGTLKWSLSEIGVMLVNRTINNIDMYAEQCTLLGCKYIYANLVNFEVYIMYLFTCLCMHFSIVNKPTCNEWGQFYPKKVR